MRLLERSGATAASLSAYGVPAERIRVVEPGTDPAPLAEGTDGTTPALLTVASLTPRKGHETLFRALATLGSLPWHLTCVLRLPKPSLLAIFPQKFGPA